MAAAVARVRARQFLACGAVMQHAERAGQRGSNGGKPSCLLLAPAPTCCQARPPRGARPLRLQVPRVWAAGGQREQSRDAGARPHRWAVEPCASASAVVGQSQSIQIGAPLCGCSGCKQEGRGPELTRSHAGRLLPAGHELCCNCGSDLRQCEWAGRRHCRRAAHAAPGREGVASRFGFSSV